MEVAGYTIIEVTADIMYLIIVGDKKDINNFVEDLNKNNKDNTIKYVSARIDIPTSVKCDQLQKLYKKKINVDNGIESAQCYTFAEGLNKKSYMLLMLEEGENNVTFSYPKMNLDDDADPEELIHTWIKKRVGKIPYGIKKSMKPLTLVGVDDNILVYMAQIKNDMQKKKTLKV